MPNEMLTVRSVVARPVLAPLARPIRTAVGDVPIAPLVLIDVATAEGIVGHAYVFAYTPVALVPLVRLLESLGEMIVGEAVAPVERMRDFDRRFRLLGWQGLLGMAVSGLDMAFWDALGQAAGQPVARLLGGELTPIPAYDSFGIVDLKADAGGIAGSVECGFGAIKIKIGGGEVAKDVEIVRAVRDMIGAGKTLMVDYNQSLDPVEALRRIERLAPFDLHWVEEPVSADDLAGHAYVRAASPVKIQTGENWWFPRGMANAVAAGASDYAMLDIMKIGGVTGWLSAMGLAAAASLPVSSHLFVEASAHMLAVTPSAHWLEYLDSAGAVLADPPRPANGRVQAKGPGLGLTWDEKAVVRFAA